MGPIIKIMFPIMLLVFISGMVIQIKEWFRLRNGCGKHLWDYYDFGNTIKQTRLCSKCGIQQKRLNDEYFWGVEYGV